MPLFFGRNKVGKSTAPCPLGTLNFSVLAKPNGSAPVVAVPLRLNGPSALDGLQHLEHKQGGFFHLTPGTYTLAIDPDSAFLAEYVVPPAVTVQVPRGGSASVRIDLDPVATITVIVKRKDGKPLEEEMTVRLTRTAPPAQTRDQATTQWRARIERVPPGSYQAIVVPRSGIAFRYQLPPPVAVTVTAGQIPGPVTLELVPLAWVSLSVVEGAAQLAFKATLAEAGGETTDHSSSDGTAMRCQARASTAGPFTVASLEVGGPDDVLYAVDVTSA